MTIFAHVGFDVVLIQLKCGACGQVGHMRTNKECPLYNKGGTAEPAPVPAKAPIGNIAVTEQEEEQLEKSNLVDQELINVEGTKVKISKTLVEQ
jgi:transcription initiation factor TFIID subunit 1